MFTWISTNTNGSQVLSIPRHLISKLEELFRGDKDVRRSSLRHLLKSNATPSDLEVITIRALITDAEASIEELHRGFSARDRSSKVVDSESQLLKIIEVHRALLSPFRYLPSEILQEIFLHYADISRSNVTIATMPWRLGHVSHRWRKVALSLPSLWDNIPKINILQQKRSHVRALICLIQRSGTSPTLKFNIIGYPLPSLTRVPGSPIIKEIMLHSERIEQLRIEVNKSTMHLFQGFKGRLGNLRILRLYVYLNANEVPDLDVFETAPVLQQVRIGGYYQDTSVRVLLPWSQITDFVEELSGKRVWQLVPLSSLHSLTNLDIYKPQCFLGESAIIYPYRPTTLPNLRTLRLLIDDCDFKNVDLFLKSLTIPVEVMKIRYMGSLIPHLVSMISECRGPYRLQKLALRTIPLQTGELGALLKLTPHLVELDIDVPPAGDLLRLIYGKGEVMLVPMLQALHMHIPVLTASTQTEHYGALAQVRCELGSRKDSEDATILSLRPGTRTWTTLHTLRFVFDSAGSRDRSQKILNNWSSSFTPEETKAIDMISLCCIYCGESSVEEILACIEHYKITNKVLHETNLHIDLRHHFIGVLMKSPDEDKLKQRVMGILAEWDQLLLNDFSGGRWARTSPELCDFSLVYVSKSKFQAMRMSPDAGLSIVYGLKLSFEEWFTFFR